MEQRLGREMPSRDHRLFRRQNLGIRTEIAGNLAGQALVIRPMVAETHNDAIPTGVAVHPGDEPDKPAVRAIVLELRENQGDGLLGHDFLLFAFGAARIQAFHAASIRRAANYRNARLGSCYCGDILFVRVLIDGKNHGFDEGLRKRRDNGVTIAAQSSHAVGNPISQRLCAGFNWPPFAIAAVEPVSTSPETVSRAKC